LLGRSKQPRQIKLLKGGINIGKLGVINMLFNKEKKEQKQNIENEFNEVIDLITDELCNRKYTMADLIKELERPLTKDEIKEVERYVHHRKRGKTKSSVT
tara:strand:- start:1097 stop:1396 length:300 start_codon:yes stop_codon:yes gene_type:complete